MLYIYNACGNIIALCEDQLLSSEKLQTLPLPSQPIDQYILWSEQHESVIVKIYNSDLSPASQCGNGLRALAHHLNKHKLSARINDNLFTCIKEQDRFWVNMGRVKHTQQLSKTAYEINYNNQHIVSLTKSIDANLISQWHKSHNVSFVFGARSNAFNITTYERGCGFTGACASATCAAAEVLYLQTQQSSWVAQNACGKIRLKRLESEWWQTGHVALLEAIKTSFVGI